MSDLAEQLRAALELDRRAYARLLDLSREQLEAARAGRTERVVELVAEKQKLVDGLEAGAPPGGAAAEARARWREERDALPPETRAGLEAKIGEVAALLAEILRLEDEARAALSRKRGAALEAMERLATARRMNRAYGKGASGGPPAARMTDQKG